VEGWRASLVRPAQLDLCYVNDVGFADLHVQALTRRDFTDRNSIAQRVEARLQSLLDDRWELLDRVVRLRKTFAGTSDLRLGPPTSGPIEVEAQLCGARDRCTWPCSVLV
jgi:hypothetical protein